MQLLLLVHINRFIKTFSSDNAPQKEFGESFFSSSYRVTCWKSAILMVLLKKVPMQVPFFVRARTKHSMHPSAHESVTKISRTFAFLGEVKGDGSRVYRQAHLLPRHG